MWLQMRCGVTSSVWSCVSFWCGCLAGPKEAPDSWLMWFGAADFNHKITQFLWFIGFFCTLWTVSSVHLNIGNKFSSLRPHTLIIIVVPINGPHVINSQDQQTASVISAGTQHFNIFYLNVFWPFLQCFVKSGFTEWGSWHSLVSDVWFWKCNVFNVKVLNIQYRGEKCFFCPCLFLFGCIWYCCWQLLCLALKFK